jgi:hypothetical protein
LVVKTKCAYCGKVLLLSPSLVIQNKNNYCCQEHYHKWVSENKIRSGSNSNLWKGGKVNLICKQCEKPYTVYKSQTEYYNADFCSRACKAKWQSIHKSGNNSLKWVERVLCKCKQCGNEFEEHKCNVKRGGGIYCSNKCKGIARSGINNPQYGKIISEETRNKQKTSHIGLQRGNKNPNWNGGVTSLYRLIRTSAKMIDWRNAVFKKDNYKDYYSGCAGTSRNQIEAHHVIPFYKLLLKYNITTLDQAYNCAPLWDVNNGRTLLHHTHKAHHDMWGIDYE